MSTHNPEPTWVARHPVKLRSAYSEVTGSEPPYTTCHSKFLGTVDYMWYTPEVSQSPPAAQLMPLHLCHRHVAIRFRLAAYVVSVVVSSLLQITQAVEPFSSFE